jgi:hypothetical protein
MPTKYYFELHIYINTWPHRTSLNVEYDHIQLLIVNEIRNTYSIQMTAQCGVFGGYAPTDLLFFGPCIAIYPYNKKQKDALFIFNLLQQLTSTCFEQTYFSSSGSTTLYIQQLVCHEFMLIGCWQDPANSQSIQTHDIHWLLYIQIVPPADEQ